MSVFRFVLLAAAGCATAGAFNITRGTVQANCSASSDYSCSVHNTNGSEVCSEYGTGPGVYPSAPGGFAANTRTVNISRTTTNGTVESHFETDVVLQWDAPHDGTRHLLKGFEVILHWQGRSWCFPLDITDFDWTQVPGDVKPRFQLHTTGTFDFYTQYTVEIQSLPKGVGVANYIIEKVNTPRQPVITQKVLCNGCWVPDCLACEAEHCCTGIPDFQRVVGMNTAVNCSRDAHPLASVWTGAFRHIRPNPYAETIMVEFLAAPPQLCFEDYELRLSLLSTPYHVKQHHVVKAGELYTEQFGSINASYGRYTFRDVAPGQYNIGLLPISRASDDRCLCPVDYHQNKHINLKDHKVTCMCTQATWMNVTVNKPELVPTATAMLPISEPPPVLAEPAAHSLMAILFLLATCLFALLCVALCVALAVKALNTWHKDESTIRIRFLTGDADKDTPLQANDVLMPSAAPRVITLVYSHDSQEHEAAVLALAAALIKYTRCQVNIDVNSQRELAANKLDWVHNTLARADRVLFVHSIGAYYRYQAKLDGGGVLERKNRTLDENGHLDDLFLIQLDYVNNLLHTSERHKLMSVYFDYTPDDYLLKHLTIDNQFRIPTHLPQLCKQVSSTPQPPGLVLDTAELDAAIAAQTRLATTDVDWFRHGHWRRPQLNRQSEPTVASYDTRTTLLMAEAEEDEDEALAAQVVVSDTKHLLASADAPPSSSVSAIAQPLSVHMQHLRHDRDQQHDHHHHHHKFIELDGTHSDVSDKTDSGVSSNNDVHVEDGDGVHDDENQDDDLNNWSSTSTTTTTQPPPSRQPASRTPLKSLGTRHSDAVRPTDDSGVMVSGERMPLVL